MPTFLLISRHSPENCPMFNEKAREVVLEQVTKMEELLKKHGVKMVGLWQVPTEHLVFEVHEAPSLEAIQKLGMEPEIARLGAYNTYEMKVATSFEEAIEMVKQAK